MFSAWKAGVNHGNRWSWLWTCGCVFAACQSSAERPPPEFGQIVTAVDAPPPVSGGTLWIDTAHTQAIVSDSDRDFVYIVDLHDQTHPRLVHTVRLNAHDEPGRITQDSQGKVYVVLRRSGDVVRIDPQNGSLDARWHVCSSPRGITADTAHGRVIIACAEGVVASITGTALTVHQEHLADDLRDVVVSDQRLWISRFRSAELIQLELNTLTLLGRAQPAVLETDRQMNVQQCTTSPTSRTMSCEIHEQTIPITMSPSVAWRTIAMPSGGVAMLHQRSQDTTVLLPNLGTVGYYGSKPNVCADCTCRIVQTTISWTNSSGNQISMQTLPSIAQATLAIDVAFAPDGRSYAIVAAANAVTAWAPQVMVLPAIASIPQANDSRCTLDEGTLTQPTGQATAVAYLSDGTLAIQTREPAALHLLQPTGGEPIVVPLSSISRQDTGHAIFHGNAGGYIACASCHPEAGEDAHTWLLTPSHLVRTQSLRGGILATAPFHWQGDLPDFGHLAGLVFTERMGGPTLSEAHVSALAHWLDAQPTPAPVAVSSSNVDAVTRGEVVFNRPDVGCTLCHGGPTTTSNLTVDVGTGGMFQVPSLRGLRWRAPYMHNGCAATIRDRFRPECGGDHHGNVNQLSASELDDLSAYLGAL